MDKKKLVIFGIDQMAEIAYFYFTNDSEYEVVAFTVDSRFKTVDSKFGLSVVSYECIEKVYPPDNYCMFIAIGASKSNLNRKNKYIDAKNKGYTLASYVSSKATIWVDIKGDNCFVLEDNTIQPYVGIGSNVILWSGNHIGHHSSIKDHCFITSHVVVSGGVTIGECSFLGVNSTIRDHIKIADNSIIGAGAWINKDTVKNGIYKTKSTELFNTDLEEVKL